MNDFKKRRLEYTKKLVENSEVLAKIEEDYGNSDLESDKRTYQILIAPCNFDELELAEALYMSINDVVTLCFKEDNYELKSYDPEDNLAASVIGKVIESLYNGEEIDVNTLVEPTPAFAARFMFDSIRGLCFEPEETLEYMAKKVGVDVEDDFEVNQFMQYFQRASELISTKVKPIFNPDDFKAKTALVKEYADEFHKLCEATYEPERNVTYRRNFGTINRVKFKFNI